MFSHHQQVQQNRHSTISPVHANKLPTEDGTNNDFEKDQEQQKIEKRESNKKKKQIKP